MRHSRDENFSAVLLLRFTNFTQLQSFESLALEVSFYIFRLLLSIIILHSFALLFELSLAFCHSSRPLFISEDTVS